MPGSALPIITDKNPQDGPKKPKVIVSSPSPEKTIKRNKVEVKKQFN